MVYSLYLNRSKFKKRKAILTMKNYPDFSIVFPVMNQEDHIESVIRSYHKELTKQRFSFELIAVINCTRDKSYEIASKVAKDLPYVSAYNLRGCGYGLGIIHGLQKAKGKYLCYLNSARIHSDELIRTLNYFLVDTSVIVHGVRLQRENEQRRLGSLLYNTFCRIYFKIPNHDINGNPNIFSREIYEKLNLQFKDSMIDLELLEKTKNNNILVVEAPIYDYSRHGGRSTTSFKTIFRLMKEAFNYW